VVAYFGEEGDLATFTSRDAAGWANWLAERCSPATVARIKRWVRQFFRAAQRDGLVSTNPFGEVKARGDVNLARRVFVSRETIERVIAAGPDAEMLRGAGMLEAGQELF
jgi:site-specific recombinase XerD